MDDFIFRVKDWWESADTETRYAVVIFGSGVLSVLVALIESSAPPRETFHRVRIDP